MSYEDVSKACGLSGKNWVFRAGVGSQAKTRSNGGSGYKVSVPENLHRLLNFLDLEPRDFVGEQRATRWGDLADMILRLDGIPVQQRRQLLDVVNAYLQAAPKI